MGNAFNSSFLILKLKKRHGNSIHSHFFSVFFSVLEAEPRQALSHLSHGPHPFVIYTTFAQAGLKLSVLLFLPPEAE
jgi:hypothetical protein